MSYFPIDTENEELKDKDEGSVLMNNDTQKKSSYARHMTPHSEKTKRLISKKQRDRYKLIKELIQKGQTASVSEQRLREMVAEAIKKYLNKMNNENKSEYEKEDTLQGKAS